MAPGAVVVGDVEIGPDSSVWYGTVVRGDVHRVRIGARSNVQDNSVLHVTRDRFACEVGDEVTIGHRAVVQEHDGVPRVEEESAAHGRTRKSAATGWWSLAVSTSPPWRMITSVAAVAISGEARM